MCPPGSAVRMKLPQKSGRVAGFEMCLEVSEVMPGGSSCGRDSLEGRQGGHESCYPASP